MDPASPHVGNESPPSRSTILGSFLRGRPRVNTSGNNPAITTTIVIPRDPILEYEEPSPPPLSPSQRRRTAIPGSLNASIPQQQPQQLQPAPAPAPPPSSSGPSLGLSQMLRRRRSAGNVNSPGSQVTSPILPAPSAPPRIVIPNGSSTGPAHRIRLVPHLDSRRSLRFEPICRDLKEGDPALRIGRFTDRSGLGLAAANALSSNKLAFKSKVVSRAHAEVWVEAGGKFMIKDTKSSSGTFLNHMRLSSAGSESKPHQLKDGDILQLGVDYQGGTEDIYKCVKIRIEMGREWQSGANAFNTNALKQLKTLAAVAAPQAGPTKTAPKSNIPDCCICLFSVTIRQALFIAPCSHTFHFKCIRPLLEAHHPAFCCPLCRTFADLEEDVEVEVEVELIGAEEADVSGSAEGEGEGEDDTGGGRGGSGGGGGGGMTTADPILPTPIPMPPDTEREREREAGAETEVENELPGFVSGVMRIPYAVRQPRHRNRNTLTMPLHPTMFPVVDLTEDGDEEMRSPVDGGGGGHDSRVEGEGVMDVDEAVVAEISDPDAPHNNNNTARDVPAHHAAGGGARRGSSEETRSRSGSAAGVVMDGEGSGSSGEGVGGHGEGDDDDGVEGEGMIGGKRKR